MARESDVAWAAGFFDGEGCVTHEKRRSGSYIRLSVNQAGSDVELKEFVRIVGHGKVNGPYRPGSLLSKKDRFQVNINGLFASSEVMELLRPHLRGPKIDTFDRLRGQ